MTVPKLTKAQREALEAFDQKLAIKRCPWCGDKDVEVELMFVEKHGHAVKCHNCRARGPLRVERNNAVREWSTLSDAVRVLLTPRPVVIVSAPGDVCGGSGRLSDGGRCPGCRACS